MTDKYSDKLVYRIALPVGTQHLEDQSDPDRWMQGQPEMITIRRPLEILSYI